MYKYILSTKQTDTHVHAYIHVHLHKAVYALFLTEIGLGSTNIGMRE